MNESTFLNIWLYGIFVFLPIIFLLSRTKLRKLFQTLVSKNIVVQKVWYVLSRVVLTVILLHLALALAHILLGLYYFVLPFFHPEMFAELEDGGIFWFFNALPFFHLARGSMENYKLFILFPYTTVICMLIYFGWVVCGEYLFKNLRRRLRLLIISIPFLILAAANFFYWSSIEGLWYEYNRVIQLYEIGIPSSGAISIVLEVTNISHTPDSDTFRGNLLVTENGKKISHLNMSYEGTHFSYGGKNFWWDSIEQKQKCIDQMGVEWCSTAHTNNTEFEFYYIQNVGVVLASKNKDLPGADSDRQNYYLTLISWDEPWQWNPRNGKYECPSLLGESWSNQNSISTCLQNYMDADPANTALEKVFSFIGDGNSLPLIKEDQDQINKFWQKVKDKEWIQLSILHSLDKDTSLMYHY